MSLSSWLVLSSSLVGLVGVVVSLSKISISQLGFELVGWVGWVGWGCSFSLENFNFSVGFELVGWVDWVVGFSS